MNYEDENIVFNVRNDHNTTSIGGMEIIENEDIVEYVNRKQLEGQNKRLINQNNLNYEGEINIHKHPGQHHTYWWQEKN